MFVKENHVEILEHVFHSKIPILVFAIRAIEEDTFAKQVEPL